MAALIIESKNPENLKLLADLAKKMGDQAKAISLDDVEDLLFGQMIEKAKTGQSVSKDEILKVLN